MSAERLGLRVAPADLTALIAAGRAIKRALDGTEVARHPEDERLSGIYGTVFHDTLGPQHQRNVAIFADGEVDRSPTRLGDVGAHRAAARRRRDRRRRDVAQRLDHRHDVPRAGDRWGGPAAC